MCFSQPSPPKVEKDEELIAAQKAQKAVEQERIREERDKRKQEAVAEASGQVGMRSLITGNRGTSGYGVRDLVR